MGTLLGLLIAASPVLRTLLEPVLVVSQTVPIIALAPLLVTWLGFDLLPKILVVALIAFSRSPSLWRLACGRPMPRSMSWCAVPEQGGCVAYVSRSCRPRVPSMTAGARVSALLVVPGAVAAELVGATDGLGRLLLLYDRDGRTTLTFSCVLLLAARGLLLWALAEAADALLARRGLLAER